LVDREQLLESLPSNVCAEIGVDKGEFSELILKITPPSKLHLIDARGDAARYHDGLKLSLTENFAAQIAQKRVEINVGLSPDVLSSFPDRYFDWVYLDTVHSYPVTAAERALLKNKVKKDGIIAGHDYSMGNWVVGLRHRVIEAVHEVVFKPPCARHQRDL
jgi:methyltransferase family protein